MADAVIIETEPSPTPAVSWPAVIAGGLLAAALTLLLLALGSGIGFSVVSLWSAPPDITSTKAATVAGIYMAVTAVMSSALGGYISGRLRMRWARTSDDELYFRDTAHGVLAWAFATVLGAAVLASATTVVAGGAAAGLGPMAAASANGPGASGSAASAVAAPFLDRLFRPDYGAAPGDARQRVGGGDLEADREVARRLLLSVAVRDLPADDRQYLVQMVAARTGISPADAERRVSAVVNELKTTLDTARRVARQLSFWLVAAMLLGAVAAGLAATEGGAARDNR